MLFFDSIRISLYVGLKIQKVLLDEVLLYDVAFLFRLAGLDVAVTFAMDLLLTCILNMLFFDSIRISLYVG